MAFFEFNVGHLIEIGMFGIAALAYRKDQAKTRKEQEEGREKLLREQVEMHLENRQRLDTLADFHENQLSINNRRDEQIGELKLQTGLLGEMAKGFARRLEMLEGSR
jgi:hypothetical protein